MTDQDQIELFYSFLRTFDRPERAITPEQAARHRAWGDECRAQHLLSLTEERRRGSSPATLDREPKEMAP